MNIFFPRYPGHINSNMFGAIGVVVFVIILLLIIVGLMCYVASDSCDRFDYAGRLAAGVFLMVVFVLIFLAAIGGIFFAALSNERGGCVGFIIGFIIFIIILALLVAFLRAFRKAVSKEDRD